MQVDSVAPNPDAIGEGFANGRCPARHAACSRPDMRLGDRDTGADATGLADVGRHGESVGSTHDVGTKAQSRVTGAAIGSRCLGLHPVEEAEGELPCIPEESGLILGRGVDDVPFQIVVLGPVDDGDLFRHHPICVIARVDDPAVGPKCERSRIACLFRKQDRRTR